MTDYTPDPQLVRQLATKAALGYGDPAPAVRVVKQDKRCQNLGDAEFDVLTGLVDAMAETGKLTVRFGDEPLTVTQLRNEVKAAWLDVRNEPARSAVAGYLAVAYDQLERACKAAANGADGGSHE